MTDAYLKALGFLDSWDAMMRAIDYKKTKSLPDNDRFDHVVIYDDPSGACLSLIETKEGYSTETLTVHGGRGNTVEVFQVMPGTAVVDLYDAEGELFTRFLAFVDDPHMYPQYSFNAVGELARYENYQVGAIAVDVKVYDSVDAWDSATEPLDESGMKMGPRFIASPWLFALHAGDATAEQASPIAMFAAICDKVEVVVNRMTGREWYRIEADCGFPCSLALSIDTVPAPQPGSVVDGKVFLTGTTGFWGGPRP